LSGEAAGTPFHAGSAGKERIPKAAQKNCSHTRDSLYSYIFIGFPLSSMNSLLPERTPMRRLDSLISAPLRRTVSAVALLLLLAPFTLPLSLFAQTASVWRVDYTGRLFGYYRMEANEPITGAADGPQVFTSLPAVQNFLKHRAVADSSTLLVGMGDNFAPEFGASIQPEFNDASALYAACSNVIAPENWRDLKDLRKIAPEVLYKSELRMPALADCDNVTRFLMTAGYRAIVPGREDFIYSGTWLRRIAWLLRGASERAPSANPIPESNGKWTFGSINSSDHKLHMLAANLRVKVVAPKAFCPLLFAKDLSVNALCTKDDSSVITAMDWLRRLDQSLAPIVEKAIERQASQDSDFRKQLIVNQQGIVTALREGYECRPEGSRASVRRDHSEGDADQDLRHETLDEDTFLNAPNKDAFCKGLDKFYDEAGNGKLMSLDARKSEVKLFLRLIAHEQKDVGYTIAALPSGQKALIIGVVGQETIQEIPSADFTVKPDQQDCLASNNFDSDLRSVICPMKALPVEKRTPFNLSVGDPRFAVTTVLRAAWTAQDSEDSKFDHVVVMAQMPPTEAEELGVLVRTDIEKLYLDKDRHPLPDRPSIDLILSEAQSDHATPEMEIRFSDGKDAPVFAPYEAYARLGYDDPYPVSTATLQSWTSGDSFQVTRNHTAVASDPSIDFASNDTDPDCESAACLLEKQLEQIRQNAKQSSSVSDLAIPWNQCGESQSCRNTVLMQHLLHQLQRSSGADVALLKRRDFYFGHLGKEYGNYDLCTKWIKTHGTQPGAERDFEEQYCELHVALDRVLWKGDYLECVMADGATLTSLMKIAQQQTSQEQTLLARDLHEEWLMTFGIATTPPTNLVAAASGPESFSPTGIEGCRSPANPPFGKATNSTTPYCVNGLPVAADHAYWISTSDQLAQDKILYSALGSLASKDSHNVSAPRDLFLTTAIAREVLRPGSPAEFSANNSSSVEKNLVTVEQRQQNRKLLQVDVSKLVAGFSMVSPDMSDSAIANSFSGVSNNQAATPHSRELDLEAAARLTSAPLPKRLTLGLQNDLEYDRKVTGNLTGNPETVVYSPSSYTVGGFAQFQLSSNWPIPDLAPIGINRSTRNLPRAFLVIAPYQFQRQITGTYLNFSYFTPPNTSNSQQQLTVHIPTAMGFSQRAALRYETGGLYKWGPDAGSYVELGPEYSVQNNILSVLLLPQLPAPYNTCPVSATQSLQTCVKANYKAAAMTLNGNSILTPVTQTLHTGGFYWNAHVQKVLDTRKSYSVSFDTSGDSFLLPGFTLPTQTRYAFSTKLALNFTIAGNLSLSPTYSDFFFENQGISSQRTSLIATSFSISAKWYFARDAQVPLKKQIWFSGPASANQTSSAKIK
jgi:hypothetical protein